MLNTYVIYGTGRPIDIQTIETAIVNMQVNKLIMVSGRAVNKFIGMKDNWLPLIILELARVANLSCRMIDYENLKQEFNTFVRNKKSHQLYFAGFKKQDSNFMIAYKAKDIKTEEIDRLMQLFNITYKIEKYK